VKLTHPVRSGTVAVAAAVIVTGLAGPAMAVTSDVAPASAPVNPDRAPARLSYIPQSLEEYQTSADAAGDRLRLTLVWAKPAQYQNFTDYVVLEQAKATGKTSYSPPRVIGRASRNSLSPAQHAFDVFYADPANADAVRAGMHNYIAGDLRLDTDYRFEVRGITGNGREVPLGPDYDVPVSTPQSAAPQFVVTGQGYAGIAGVPSAADGGALQYTSAIQAAINDAAAKAAQTGTPAEVVIPAGVQLRSGPVYLKSNVTLRVDGTLTESLDLALSGEGTDFLTSSAKYPSLVNVNGSSSSPLRNVRIVGTGTIDGQGWLYGIPGAPDVEYARQLGLAESKEATVDTIEQNGVLAKEIYDSCVAAGGPAGNSTCYGKRSNLISGSNVDNMYVGDGLRVQNPAQHTIAFSATANYVVNGIVVQSFNSNNGDCVDFSGVGFTAVNNVLNCGDDNIAITASGSNGPPSGSVWVFDNYLARGHGGVAFGSGLTSWVDNVLIEDDVFVGTSNGIRSKSKPGSGGGVRFVTARDLAMKDLTNRAYGKIDPLVVGFQMDGAAFIFTTEYPGAYQNIAWPVYHDYTISNVSVDGTQTAGIIVDGLHDQAQLDALGIPFQPSNNIHFTNVRFQNAGIPRLDYLTNSTFDNVTFRGPRGKLIAGPWVNVTNLDNVTADGRVLPSSGLHLTARPQGQAVYTGQRDGLTFVSNGSFDRFYPETLPADVRIRAGTILIDGVPLPAQDYPSFQPKLDGGDLRPGTDSTVLIAPGYQVNVHTVVTFRKNYLDTLSRGKHALTFVFANGTASSTINIASTG
jgi:exo-poly-alpha-galacturonosidase